jgi:hypothetical protein
MRVVNRVMIVVFCWRSCENMVLNSWRKDANWELWSMSVGGVDGDAI